MSFKQIHDDNKREAKLQKAEAERERQLASLRKQESDLETAMAEVQSLPSISQLREQLIVVRNEIARIEDEK